MPTPLEATASALRAYALSLPEAVEDFPWGERVVKVNKKVFVFLGTPKSGGLSVSVKLPVTGERALDLPFVKPTGYGLGKSGWVSARFAPIDQPDPALLRRWIQESYRAIATKKLVKLLDSAHA